MNSTDKEKEEYYFKIFLEVKDLGTKRKVSIEDYNFEGSWPEIMDGFLNLLRSLGFALPSNDNEDIIDSIENMKSKYLDFNGNYSQYDENDEEEENK